MILTRLLEKHEGNKRGVCVFCGVKTEKGHELKLSENFTAWNLLNYGSVICEYCISLIRDQKFRRKSWVISKHGVKFINRSEAIDLLMNPPEPPFTIYLTKTGKKQGFIQLINKMNYSKNRFFIAFDDNLVFIERDKLEEMVKVVEEARKLKFTKSELLGDIKIKRWKYRKLCEKILEFKGNDLWEVIVWAVK